MDKKTLSDKIFSAFPSDVLNVENVKEFINDLLKPMEVPVKGDRVGFVINEFRRRIKEGAGEGLTQDEN